MNSASLRSRLILIILPPILAIAIAAGVWEFRTASKRAEGIFDRGLLSAALSISRDVSLTDGDALGPSTRSLIADTSGGELFYHVYAPDGVFIIGYATPPVGPHIESVGLAEPLFFEAEYRNNKVRVLRFTDATQVGDIAGIYTITVWQEMVLRAAFVRDIVVGRIAVIAALIASVAIVVWFGVRIGLRPLDDLQNAISLRSSTDLQPIRRAVPIEVQGIVGTLNALLGQVSEVLTSKNNFISNAAHQLRNPIAGVLALSEAVQFARTPEDMQKRTSDLVVAAREASTMANQLLSFERANALNVDKRAEIFDLNGLAEAVAERASISNKFGEVTVDLKLSTEPVPIKGDRPMLQEAIQNLLDNALVHGGNSLSKIEIAVQSIAGDALLLVKDDGVGINDGQIPLVLERFGQANAGPGSGLGLPIAEATSRQHGGKLRITAQQKGATVAIILPMAAGEMSDEEPAELPK